VVDEDDREIIATCLSELGVTAQLFGNVADTECISGMKLDSESKACPKASCCVLPQPSTVTCSLSGSHDARSLFESHDEPEDDLEAASIVLQWHGPGLGTSLNVFFFPRLALMVLDFGRST
jgi:hypothetical protein